MVEEAHGQDHEEVRRCPDRAAARVHAVGRRHQGLRCARASVGAQGLSRQVPASRPRHQEEHRPPWHGFAGRRTGAGGRDPHRRLDRPGPDGTNPAAADAQRGDHARSRQAVPGGARPGPLQAELSAQLPNRHPPARAAPARQPKGRRRHPRRRDGPASPDARNALRGQPHARDPVRHVHRGRAVGAEAARLQPVPVREALPRKEARTVPVRRGVPAPGRRAAQGRDHGHRARAGRRRHPAADADRLPPLGNHGPAGAGTTSLWRPRSCGCATARRAPRWCISGSRRWRCCAASRAPGTTPG